MEMYEKILKIGRGATSEVFLMRNKETKKCYAVKKIKVDALTQTRSKESLLQEAIIMGKVVHPNVVMCHEYFCDPDAEYVFIIQDYCDGGTLDDHIKQRKGVLLPEDTIMDWFIQLTLAVQHIHSLKVLHRDIKTSNVFLTKKGRIRLGDFGISKIMCNTMDMANTCIGTPYYLSPELCQDIPYSSKSDIWALGCVLYEMCALKPAFNATNLISLFYKIVKGEYAPLPDCYSSNLHLLVKSILDKCPDSRPSTNGILSLCFVQEHLKQFIQKHEFRLYEESSEKEGNRDNFLVESRSKTSLAHHEHSEADKRSKSAPPTSQEADFDVCELRHPEELSSNGDKSYYSEDFDNDSLTSVEEDLEEDSFLVYPNGEIPEEIGSSDGELPDYPDDFEDAESDTLEMVVNHARSALDSSSDNATFQDNQEDQDGHTLSETLKTLCQQCIDDVGQSMYSELSSHFLRGLTPADLQPQFEYKMDQDRLETCYIIFSMDQDSSKETSE
ncbi:uncharacterized protein [Hyperolius riggenbachi]|uniref:uncharacterized protein n=1 Tax=Hyperolius riggenbachi TaxID=752182 RepID=UPI0035A38021